MKDPYELLGLTRDTDEHLLKERYEQLVAKYKEDRFLPGEEGNTAAEKLNEIQEAWRDISRDLEARRYSSDYDRIADLIKSKKYDDAQDALDAVSERGAQWHFYQSQVYYYREWLTECRKQLSIAIDLDPQNEKYRTAMQKLDTVMGNGKADPKNVHSDMAGDDIDAARAQADSERNYESAAMGNSLSNCCTAYCLTSLCCDAMSCCCR